MMRILKDVTEGIEPFQQPLWDKVSQGGFKKGEMMVISAGRQTGKSYVSMYMKLLKNRIYDTNLCKEIFLSADYEACMLGYPKSAAALKKLMPKYQFSRAKWYDVHLFSKSWDPVQERLDWCEKQFGPQPKKADAWSRWYTMHTTLRFRDAKDYEWFILRWGT